MVLVFEEKEKAVKLLVNPRKQVAKAMQVGKQCCSTILFFCCCQPRRWPNI